MDNKKKIVLSEEIVYDVKQYYTGKTYIHQGEYYPCTCDWTNRSEAKIYSTKGKASKACEILNKKTGRCFVIDEID